MNPWDRQPGESGRAYSSFMTYRDMNEVRTFLGAYRQHTGRTGAKRVPGHWCRRVKSWRWDERARAWDAYFQQAMIRAKLKRERVLTVFGRHKNLNAACDLVEVPLRIAEMLLAGDVEKMLQSPFFEVEQSQVHVATFAGEKVAQRITVDVDLTMADLLRFMKELHALRRTILEAVASGREDISDETLEKLRKLARGES